MKKKLSISLCFIFLNFYFPIELFAQEANLATENFYKDLNLSSQAFVVADASNGKVILEKNAQAEWVPASLTKLVTALVFLDTNPNMEQSVKITLADQKNGGCSSGGACLKTKVGVAYKLKDLFYASLIASANNATLALARSTELSADDFVQKMNEKARILGANHTVFFEASGMDPNNKTTAQDFAIIARAALQNPVIAKILAEKNYSFVSSNSKRYKHNLKTTNKLLGDQELDILSGKTGYLQESGYNFASLIQDQYGENLVVIVFGSKSNRTQFEDTKQLAAVGTLVKSINYSVEMVLGTSTIATSVEPNILQSSQISNP